MYIPIIVMILFIVYHIIKVRYSAFCASTYKIFCERRLKPNLFPENSVSDSMLEVLSNDIDYRETTRVLKAINFLNIKPFVYVFENRDFQLIDEIKPNINQVLKRFKDEFKETL